MVVRTDPNKDKQFRFSQQWKKAGLDMAMFISSPNVTGPYQQVAQPFSGHERNRLFLQTAENFDDVSLVSGSDFREDGRGFALLDFDHDGWLDIAATSPNVPSFRLLRNTMGDSKSSTQNGHVKITLVGGATEAKSQTQWSARDAIGASIVVTIGDSKRRFQLAAGEGLSTQNAKQIHVGMGDAQSIDQVDVFWPSGKTTVHRDLKVGVNAELLERE